MGFFSYFIDILIEKSIKNISIKYHIIFRLPIVPSRPLTPRQQLSIIKVVERSENASYKEPTKEDIEVSFYLFYRF